MYRAPASSRGGTSPIGDRMRGSTQANVRFIEIEDAGHFFLDFYGEDLADLIAEFLADNGV